MSMLVRHAMTELPRTATPQMSAQDAARIMAEADVGTVPVAEDGRLFGLVTDRDLVVRVLAGGGDPATPLGDIATQRSLVTISPDSQLAEARKLMAEHRIRRLPVVKGKELVGILAMGDVANANASKREVGEVLEEISASPSTTSLNEGPERGTPERARKTGGSR